MPKYRFRKTIDLDIDAESPEEARKELSFRCALSNASGNGVLGDSGSYELLGPAEIQDLPTEAREIAQHMKSNTLVMSVQYRGENFACLCTKEELGPDHISVKPVALLLTGEQKEFITDVYGKSPESGLREKLNLG